ncbi:RHS repeat protein, partial [Pseudomonas putida]|nr:RHS repeat protein [Pseudomonas putida]
VLKIRNDAEATRFWRNQKVVPENTYTYDSLYQLASATGREMANAGQPGRHLPHVTPFDSATYTSYMRTYRYDTAGNLRQIRHSAPATNHNYTTDITVSDRSNRAVLSTLAQEPSAVEALFTPGGQQAVLLPGQPLAWSSRAELKQVVSVKREGATDDGESYRYDSHSQRVLKASTQRTASSTQAQRVIYLPGLELRTHTNGDTLTQDLQVMTVGEAGRAQVRVLHWQAGKPDDLANDQLRYSYDNLLGSSALEVDGAGNLISQEEYYPFGGTAVWVARNEVEASYKTVRYSGKERDATGLYYYGYRYYQPWAGRWLSADPAGTVDGLNLFSMVGNNPVTRVDVLGLAGDDPNDPTQGLTKNQKKLAKRKERERQKKEGDRLEAELARQESARLAEKQAARELSKLTLSQENNQFVVVTAAQRNEPLIPRNGKLMPNPHYVENRKYESLLARLKRVSSVGSDRPWAIGVREKIVGEKKVSQFIYLLDGNANEGWVHLWSGHKSDFEQEARQASNSSLKIGPADVKKLIVESFVSGELKEGGTGSKGRSSTNERYELNTKYGKLSTLVVFAEDGKVITAYPKKPSTCAGASSNARVK